MLKPFLKDPLGQVENMIRLAGMADGTVQIGTVSIETEDFPPAVTVSASMFEVEDDDGDAT